MSHKSKLVSIGELERNGAIVGIQDGNHGEKHPKATDYTDDGVPFIMANNVINNRVDVENAAKLPSSLADSLRIGFAQSGDVLLTHKGTVGNTAIVDTDLPYLMLTPQVTYYRTDQAKLRRHYLLYAFRESLFQKTMKSLAQQATRPYIGITAQRRLKVRWKPPVEQDRVINILSAYDDLIENNRRRIQLLEQAARLLYKEWFVHLRFPGHEHVKVVDGVPEGWEKATLGEVVMTNAESHKKGKVPDPLNYIDIGSVRSGRILEKTTMGASEAPGRARRKAKHGDVIWSNVRPNLRAYALILNPFENDVFSTGFTVLEATDVPFTFLYNFVTTSQFVGHLVNHATGAGYPAVRPDDFERAELVKPPTTLLEMFHNATLPLYVQQHVLETQNDGLAAARDLLLPRLMNGEIAV